MSLHSKEMAPSKVPEKRYSELCTAAEALKTFISIKGQRGNLYTSFLVQMLKKALKSFSSQLRRTGINVNLFSYSFL